MTGLAARAWALSWRLEPGVVVALFLITGLTGDWLAPADPTAVDLTAARSAPSSSHLLGTDHLGRDELSRLITGARGSAIAVVLVLSTSLLLGSLLGITAGWRGGLVDRAMLRLVDVATGVPALLLGLVLAGLLGGSSLDVGIALAATSWPPYVRVIRTETRVRRDDPSNQALTLLGAGPWHILLRHVLPALSGPVTVLLGLSTAEVILSVATLSFLGLGARPPTPEWGSMLVESQPYLLAAPWLFLAPAVALTLVAASCTVLAERAGGWFTHGTLERPGKRPRVVPGSSRPGLDETRSGSVLDVRDLSVELMTPGGALRVVDSVSFSVARGQTLAIVGPSGSGKTMAMLGVLRLFPPTVTAAVTGSVQVSGRELVGLPEHGLREVRGATVAYVPQDLGSALNPLRRVGAQVAAVARRHQGLDRKAARRRAVELLGTVGLAEPERVGRQRPGELSGGMRQRVLLAAALAGGPDLLIADEPTSALDVTAAVELVQLLRGLQAQLGLTLVIVTHELGVAAQLASRVAVFDRGRIVEEADVPTLLHSAQHPTTVRLLAAAGRPRIPTGSGAPAPGGDGTDMETYRASSRPVDPDMSPCRERGTALLEVRELRVEYPRRGRRGSVLAVDGVDFDLRAGEAVGVVGNSGCGKSSLARALVGLEPWARGSVRLGGHPVRARDGRVQLVFQDPTTALDRRQTIGAAVSEALALSKAEDLPARTHALLERVGLTPEHATRRPWQLSGGERQRAVIARSLAGRPELLVLDEPVSALDAIRRLEIVEVLASLRDDGLAMVLISHDLGVVERLVDRVLVMHDARVVEVLTTDRPGDPPHHAAARELSSARTFFSLTPAPDAHQPIR
ncbi:MAG: ATP-binding cassette domain-containing protein [Pseudonocardiaceae bacterium]